MRDNVVGRLTLGEYALITFDEDYLTTFSRNVDPNKITILSHLG